MDKGIKFFFTLIFSLIAYLFLTVFYRGHIMHMEFNSIFLFSWDFLLEKMSVPGGLTQLLLAFIIQFFHVPALGALFVTALLVAVSLLTYRMCRTQTVISFVLSFIPALFLFAILCLSTAVQINYVPAVAILLSLCLAVSTRNSNAFICAVLVPFAYYLIGPLSFIYPLVLLPTRKLSAVPSLLVYVACVILAYFLYIPNLSSVLFDVNAGLDTFGNSMIVFRVLPFVLTFLVVLLPQFNENAHIVAKTGFPLIILSLMFASCFAHYNEPVERVCRYDALLQRQDWEGILKMSEEKAPSHFEEVACTDLALAVTGRLENEMFHYPQGGPSSFVTPFSPAISPMYAAEIFKRIGLLSQAQRYVFETQVAGFVSETNARCHKNLAEINAALGFSAVAQKYADELSRTLFYSNWAKDFDASARCACLTDSLGTDVYYNDGNFGQTVAGCLKINPEAEMARTYMLCWFILSNDLDAFAANVDFSRYVKIPVVYQQAYVLYWAQHHDDFSKLPSCISPEIAQGLMDFASARSQGRSAEYLKKHFGKTYWFYAFYSNPQ